MFGRFITAGCVNAPEQMRRENLRDFIHPNGLIVKLNEDFAAKRIDNGFLVELADGSNKNMRYPVEIKIYLLEAEKFPVDDSIKQKDFGDRKVSYQVGKTCRRFGQRNVCFRRV